MACRFCTVLDGVQGSKVTESLADIKVALIRGAPIYEYTR